MDLTITSVSHRLGWVGSSQGPGRKNKTFLPLTPGLSPFQIGTRTVVVSNSETLYLVSVSICEVRKYNNEKFLLKEGSQGLLVGD